MAENHQEKWPAPPKLPPTPGFSRLQFADPGDLLRGIGGHQVGPLPGQVLPVLQRDHLAGLTLAHDLLRRLGVRGPQSQHPRLQEVDVRQ